MLGTVPPDDPPPPIRRDTGQLHPTRLRLVQVAARLFQQRGLNGVGVTEILSEAGVPKGSLYHHFPGGKPELAQAAIAWVADEAIAGIERGVAAGIGVAGYIGKLARDSAQWLEKTNFRDGSLLAVIGQEEAAAAGPIGDAVKVAYQRIELRLAKWMMAEGLSLAAARDQAATAIAAMEGALVLARARRDTAPLKLVAGLLIEAGTRSQGAGTRAAGEGLEGEEDHDHYRAPDAG